MDSSQHADCNGHRFVAAAIEVQRRQLFKASAVVDMCRLACASKLEGFDPEQMELALRVVDGLINDAAGMLERLASNSLAD